MEVVTKNMKGLLLCLLIVVPAWFLGTAFPIIGGPVIAIILGMIVTLFIKDKSSVQTVLIIPPRKFCSTRLFSLDSD